MIVELHKIAQRSPDDTSGLQELIERGLIDPASVVAVLGKTEGNGCVNDFTRGFATTTVKHYLADLIGPDQADEIVYVMSGGTEGVLSPHLNVFTRRDASQAEPPTGGLALGVRHTRDFEPNEIGSLSMVDEVAAAVTDLMAETGMGRADVHFVQIKCPLVSSLDLPSASSSPDSYKSMAYSRAASALGVATALGEVDRADLEPSAIGRDFSLFSSVASTSAGLELRNCEILVLGNSATSRSRLRIGHSVMAHALDLAAVDCALAAAGVESGEESRIVTVLAKAEASPTGEVLGRRHTMLDDSDVSHTRMARAVVGSAIAARVQDPMIYVSGGSEHQGPPGGGPVAVIAGIDPGPGQPDGPNAAALARLTEAARDDLAALAYPTRSWVKPTTVDGQPVDDVLIVGGGQSGVVIAASLRREGLERVSVLEAADPGDEGPWTTYARMAELRTPKQLVGHELGVPNLSIRSWYRTRFSPEAWERIERIPRTAWKEYLDWLATTTGVVIEHQTAVLDIHPAEAATGDEQIVAVETMTNGRPRTRYARAVVLATGFEGAGGWTVPEVISRSLPSDRFHHSNVAFDLSTLAGKRVAVLGHGASAFDNANAALDAGAVSVDLCFRRSKLPRTNPHRFLETAGTMSHFADLSDETRWLVTRHFRLHDQPPPVATFERARERSNLRLRPGTDWTQTGLDGDEVVVTTTGGELRVDHVIAATGATVDLARRPELRSLLPHVALWRDRYQPPVGQEDDQLAALPYLDGDYRFQPVHPSPASDWVGRVFSFNFASALSHAPHATSISGHKHAVPRLVRGVTRRLLLDMEPHLVPDLRSYVSADLPVEDDFEQRLASDDQAISAATSEVRQ